jgi:chromosome segregation ATPase
MENNICHNPECDNPIPEAKLAKGAKYCSTKCKRHVNNQTALNRKKGLDGTNQQNEDSTMEHEENKLSVVGNNGPSLPSPTNEPTLAYIIKNLENDNTSLKIQVGKWQDKYEHMRDTNLDLKSEISDLKRELAKKEDEMESKQGLAGIMDGMKDNEGRIDWSGLGQAAAAIASSLKGAGVPAQLAGSDLPEDEYVKAFAAWWVTLDDGMKNQAWQVINAMASNTESIEVFLNSMEDGNHIRQAAH